MKQFLVCLYAMFALGFGHAARLEFKRSAETGSINRFETVELASNDEPREKRAFAICNSDTCQSGYQKSKYCTSYANSCFGSGQVVYVKFSPSFKKAPKVMIGLTLVDTHKDQNVRVRASAEQVTAAGFNIRFAPWSYSITYQIGVNWMACP